MRHSKPVRLGIPIHRDKPAPTVLPFGRRCFQLRLCGVVRKPHLPGDESGQLFLEFTISCWIIVVKPVAIWKVRPLPCVFCRREFQFPIIALTTWMPLPSSIYHTSSISSACPWVSGVCTASKVERLERLLRIVDEGMSWV